MNTISKERGHFTLVLFSFDNNDSYLNKKQDCFFFKMNELPNHKWVEESIIFIVQLYSTFCNTTFSDGEIYSSIP
jgi:hypothetical protein